MFAPFVENEFLVRALIAGSLISILTSVVGTYVVLRGLAFIGDALAHGILPGVALASLAGAPVLLGAGVGAVVMIGGVGVITARSRLSHDTAIGLLFVGLLAFGVVLVSSSRNLSGDLEAILFGEFLGVDDGDLWRLAGATITALVGSAAIARPMLLSSFDEDLARSMGVHVRRYRLILLASIAATVVISFQAVGSLLVFGMLLAPAATGALVARRIPTMMLIGTGVGITSTYLGLLASYHFDWAAGASVVLTAVAIFFLALFASFVFGFRKTRPVR